jgi:hypothetical protein
MVALWHPLLQTATIKKDFHLKKTFIESAPPSIQKHPPVTLNY